MVYLNSYSGAPRGRRQFSWPSWIIWALLITPITLSGCLNQYSSSESTNPLPEWRNLTREFNLRISQVFSPGVHVAAPNGDTNCIRVKIFPSGSLVLNSRADWIPAGPNTAILTLGVVKFSHPPTDYGRLSGESPLVLTAQVGADSKITVYSDDFLIVYLGLPHGSGVSIAQSATLLIEVTHTAETVELIPLTCALDP